MHGEPCRFCVVNLGRQAKATEIQLAELRRLSDEHQQAHEQEKAYMAKERQAIVAWLRELAGDHGCVNKDVEIWLDGLTEPTAPLTLLYFFLRDLADRIDNKDFALREPEPPEETA